MANGNDGIDVRIGATDEGVGSVADAAAAKIKAANDAIVASYDRMADAVYVNMVRMNESVKENSEKTAVQFEKLEATMSKLQKAFSVALEIAAFGFIGDQIGELISKFADYGHALEEASQKTGLTTDRLQELGYVGQVSGLSTEQMTQAMVHLSRTMGEAQEGNKQATAALEAVGIKSNELKNIKLDEALLRIADAFAAHADGANKNKIALELFQRSGADLIPILNRGSEGVNELSAKARELGVVMDAEAVKSSAELHDKLVDLSAQSTILKNDLVLAVYPAIQSITEAMIESREKGGAFQQFMEGLGDVLKGVASAALIVAAALLRVGTLAGAVAATVGAIFTGNGQAENIKAIWGAWREQAESSLKSTEDRLNKLWSKPKGFDPNTDEPPYNPYMDGGKPKFNLKDNTKGGSDALKAEYALRAAMLQADYALQKQHLDDAKALYDEAYANGLVDIKGYYAAQLLIEQEGLKAQMDLKKADIANARQQLKKAEGQNDGTGPKEAAVLQFRTRLVQLTGELNVLEDKYTQASVQNAAKREDAERKLNSAIEESNIATTQKVASDSIKSAQDVANSRYAMGLITKDQLIAIERELTDKQYDIDREAIQKRLALENTATYKNPQKIAELNNQLLQLDSDYSTKVIANAQKMNEALSAPYTGMINSVKDGFTKGISEMLDGTKSFKQGLQDIFTSILQAFDKMIAEKIVSWVYAEVTQTQATTAAVAARTTTDVASQGIRTSAALAADATKTASAVTAESTMTAATVAGNAYRTASDWEAAVESTAATAWAAVKNIAAKAWEAAASVYASIAAIPYVGPFLAPVMAVAAAGLVVGFAAHIASAEGGYDIPKGVNPVTQLHEEEMVLPKAQADVIRNMANQAANQGARAQGDTHVHIHAVDAASFEKRLAQSGGTLSAMLRDAHRNGVTLQNFKNMWGTTG